MAGFPKVIITIALYLIFKPILSLFNCLRSYDGTFFMKSHFSLDFRTTNIEQQTSNIEQQTSNNKHRISNIEYRTSNIEYRISNQSCSKDLD